MTDLLFKALLTATLSIPLVLIIAFASDGLFNNQVIANFVLGFILVVVAIWFALMLAAGLCGIWS